jgi:NADH:ubiquinone oxidoreductase subunit H
MIPNLIRRFVIMAVAVPLAAFGARKLSDAVERRRGPNNRATRLLRQGADTLQGFRRPKKRRFSFSR